MKKKTTKLSVYVASLGEVLKEFDLKKFKSWTQKHNLLLWKRFKMANETVQMATMCKCICNRTDLLNTEACQKARKWLAEHNMSGRIF